jgi:hypothetical protein
LEETRRAIERYEQAHVDKAVDALDASFWLSPHDIRYALHEHGYGSNEIYKHYIAYLRTVIPLPASTDRVKAERERPAIVLPPAQAQVLCLLPRYSQLSCTED